MAAPIKELQRRFGATIRFGAMIQLRQYKWMMSQVADTTTWPTTWHNFNDDNFDDDDLRTQHDDNVALGKMTWYSYV
jgi:hypothetical protein